jgi:uncharacterized protein with ATP-grasp and redox domains
LPRLCQLADPENYTPFDWDLIHDAESRRYWIELFTGFSGNIRGHLLEDGLEGEDFEPRWVDFLNEYQAGVRAFRDRPAEMELTTIRLGKFRQVLLNKYGWPDPFARVKRRENDLALKLYPQVVDKIDRLALDDRWLPLVQSMFAGNMFDLGSPKTIEMYRQGGVTYETLLERVSPRPWHIDHFDVLVERLGRRSYRQILFFADNAGLDVTLGVIPVARELARQGMPVVLAVNSVPALNDITFDELSPLLDRLVAGDPVLRDLLNEKTLRTVASGCGIPLIDFAEVSEACNSVAAESDLIVIEGMGRGVESNWRQCFKCDAWRIALVKDVCVARWIGGKVFDAVCRFDVKGR